MSRLHKNKIVILIILFPLCGLALLGNYFNDTYKRTREELSYFQSISLDSCLITKISERKYSGRGDYFVFYTPCEKEYLPILLEKEKFDDYKLFKENSIIYKKSNSNDIIIKDNGTIYNISIRETEFEDRPMIAAIIIIMFGGLIVYTILSPNSLYEKK